MCERQVVIIGAGPSGLAAALQLKRQRIEPLVMEKQAIGGLLNNAYLVENYPGFPGGISGRDLIAKMREHIFEWGIEIAYDSVNRIHYNESEFKINTGSGVTFSTEYVIIASGTVPRTLEKTELNIPPNRVFYDILAVQESNHDRFVIIGTGDAAFDYGLNLSRKNTVNIIGRGDRVRCLDILYERARASSRILVHLNTMLRKVDQNSDGSLNVQCQRDNELFNLEADHLIVAIGREPCVGFLDTSILDRASDLQNRGVLHLIGDVRNGRFRQTAIAVGDGIRAAMCVAEDMKIRRILP